MSGSALAERRYDTGASDTEINIGSTMKTFMAFVDKYMPGANLSDISLVYGFAVSQTLEQVLRQCGDDLTREKS